MNLFQRFKITRELSRLEQKARENPSPSTYVDIAQVYINLGMMEQTLRIAEQGLALFPNAEELKKVHRFARRNHVNGRIQQLRLKIGRVPDPESYQELAEIYLDFSDSVSVQAVCDECIRRFPDDPGAYLVLARAGLKSFYRDLTARDGLAAMNLLRKVVAMGGDPTEAHKLLADVLYRVGAVEEARTHVEVLRAAGAEDAEVEALEKDLRGKVTVKADLELLFHAVEETGSFIHPPVTHEKHLRSIASGENLHLIREGLGQVAALDGVVKAAFLHGSHAVVKGQISDGKDPFLRTARLVARAAQRTCRRMDVGNFSKGVVEGSFGRICLCCYGEVISAVLCGRGGRTEGILTALQDLVSSALIPPTVEAGP